MNENEAVDNTEETTEGEKTPSAADAADAVAELKQELERIKDTNNQLLGRLDQMSRIPEQPKPAPKQYTPEEYKNLMQTDPALAVRLAVEGVVNDQVKPLVADVQLRNDKAKWDTKAENEFPAIRTDKEFASAVAEQVRDLVRTDGRSPDDPTLLYRAAQIASAKLGRKITSPRAGMSGEAPNSGGSPGTKSFKPPTYFDSFGKVFGLSDESKKRLMAKMEANSKKGVRR